MDTPQKRLLKSFPASEGLINSPFYQVEIFLFIFVIILQLPREIVNLILEPFQRNADSYIVRFVCKSWLSLIEINKLISFKKALNHYASNNYKSLLVYLYPYT